MRLSFKKTIDDRIRYLLNFRIILFCNFDISRVNSFIGFSKIMNSHVKDKEDIVQLITNYNRSLNT